MLQRNALLPFVIYYASFILNKVAASSSDDFTYGDEESNSCPESYYPITSSLWACRAAMSMADSAFKDDLDGENFQGDENDADFPKGCYSCSKKTGTCAKGFWFNEHTEGTGENSARLFCAKPNVVNDSTKVAFIGDSDVDYWHTTELVIPGSYNYGVGGYTCKNVIAEIDNLLDTVSPNVIVLVCGENDLDKKSVDKTFKNFKEIVGKAKSRDIQVIYLGTKPEPSTKSLHKKYRMYDTKIKEWAVTLFDEAANNPTPLTVIDVYPVFDAHENKKDLYYSDKLHLSDDGYDLWNTWLQIAYKEIYPGKINSCPVWKNGLCFNKSDDNKSYEIDCNACNDKKCKKKCKKIKKKSDKQKDKFCEKHSNKGTPKSFCV